MLFDVVEDADDEPEDDEPDVALDEDVEDALEELDEPPERESVR